MTLRIASLLEIMKHFNVSHLVAALDTMKCLEDGAKYQCDHGKADSLVKDNPVASNLLEVGVDCCVQFCDELDMGRARLRLMGDITVPFRTGTLTLSQLQSQAHELLEDMKYQLSSRRFVRIEPHRAIKYGKFGGEWEGVLRGIPESVVDCCEGMDCYAVGLYTAGVFHAMRVAEIGLRVLAKKLKVRITDKGKVVPIEFGDWDKVLQGIRGKIAKARTLPKNKKRDTLLTFYSKMADHCEYMKDYWRNPTAHCRKQYNEGECLGALERVRDFMLLIVKGAQ